MNISRHAYAIAGLTCILAATSFGTGRLHTGAGTAPVTVMNTSTNPVPVTGNVTASVSGTIAATQSGNWNVGQSGSWSVGINGPVTVQSGNTPVSVTDSGAASRSPVDFEISMSASGTDSMGSNNDYVVPDGKRLVLQYVAAYGELQSGQKVTQCQMNGITVSLDDRGDDGSVEWFQASEQVQASFDAGTTLSVSGRRNNASNSGVVFVHAFGYLEPMP